MELGDAMARIAEEAERQGFLVRQTRSSMWQFRKGNDNWLMSVRTLDDLLDVLRVLISAGLDWSDPD
jgi:hypothetical protein